jgi:putative transposase
MMFELNKEGRGVNRKRVQRLMRVMGIEALVPRPGTSKLAPGHKIYPYLLHGLAIAEPNHVWAADITYIPMARGFLYLVAIIDWASRAVLAWRLSNTGNVAGSHTPGNITPETRLPGWGTWIRTRINGVRVASPGP